MFCAINPITDERIQLPLTVKGIGSQENQCTIEREFGYPEHQIIFSRKGSGVLCTSDGEFSIDEGNYFYLKPFEKHQYSASSKIWSTDWILFDFADEENVSSLFFSDSKVGLTSSVIDEVFYNILSLLNRNELNSNLLASSELYRLLVLLKTKEIAIESNTTSNQKLLKPVIEYIDANYNQSFTLENLSDLIHVTPQYLCKVFKATYEIRIFEYVTKKRMQVAKKLLLETQLPIKEIAHLVGYQESSYFGSIFKKHENMTASLYRGR